MDTVNDSLHILVVEDELVTAAYIKKLLKDLKYSVAASFASGEAALEFLTTHSVDVVLMDIVLDGELDGIDTARIITEKYDIPVIYLTSFSDEQKINRATFTEPYGYILKPVNERELHANIRMTMHKSAMERQIRQNEARFKSIIEYSPLAVVTCNSNYVYNFANDNFVKLFKPGPDNCLEGNSILPIICPFPDQQEKLLAIMSREGVIRGFSATALDFEGNELDICLSGSLINNGTDGIEFFIEDMTERIRVESIARQTEAKFSALFNTPSLSYVLIDRFCRIQAYNQNAFGLIQDLYGIALVHETTLSSCFPGIQSTCEENLFGKIHSTHLTLERQVIDKKNTERWFELTFSAVPNRLAVPDEFAVAIKEITDKKRLEAHQQEYIVRLELQQQKLEEQSAQLHLLNEKLQLSEADLKELNFNKDKFFSIIAQDLRTPFQTLIGFTEYILEDFEKLPPETIKSIASQVNKSIKHVFGLLDNLLMWAKLQTDKIEFSPERVVLYDLIQKQVHTLASMSEQKMLQLQFDIPRDIILMLDTALFSSVISNLLSNAIKFTPRGGYIRISYQLTAVGHQIIVTDNGIGMTTEQQDMLFKIQESVLRNGTELENGTGLGLILTKQFVELHGGSINVLSHPNNGSTFTVILPLTSGYIPLHTTQTRQQ
ncbi:MAG: response regulator [Ignavibacteria bacterium]|nr:response regulator [Ignavibacteria bacterium]